MPDADLVPVSNVGEAALTKHSPPLDIRSTALKPSAQYPMDVLVAVTSNTPITYANNTPVDPTEAFKTIVSDIIESLPFLIAPISYEPETVRHA